MMLKGDKTWTYRKPLDDMSAAMLCTKIQLHAKRPKPTKCIVMSSKVPRLSSKRP